MKSVLVLLFIFLSVFAFSQKKVTKEYEKIEPYKEGLSWVYNSGNKGLINNDGKELIPCRYESISLFKDDLYWVINSGMKGLFSVNKNKLIIKTEYETIEPIDNNRFKVFHSGVEQIIELK